LRSSSAKVEEFPRDRSSSKRAAAGDVNKRIRRDGVKKGRISVAITRLDDYEGGHVTVRIHRLLLRVTGRSMQLVAIGAFAMKHRSSIIAAQQLFADSPSALFAYIQHK